MGRIADQFRMPSSVRSDGERDLSRAVGDLQRVHAQQINLQAEGRIAASAVATDAKPTYTATPGDFAPNKYPVTLGSPGSQYIIVGWIYTTDGVWEATTKLVD